MKIPVEYQYTTDEIPPRCRKMRAVRHTDTTELTFAEITKAEAPVAIIEKGRDFNRKGTWGSYRQQYRWWNGQLWVPYSYQEASGKPHQRQRTRAFQKNPVDFHFIYSNWDSYGFLNQTERLNQIQEGARNNVFIDGLRYSTIGEPRYVIMTFGLGGNHGLGHGTDLMTSNSYNSNISYQRYFRIDQYKAALAETEKVALARGDTKALPVEKQRPTQFSILIPDSIQLTPQVEHGTGDPFLNQMEVVIESVKTPLLAGVIGLSMAFRQ